MSVLHYIRISGTSSDTLSPLSPMEEEYGTSGGVKRLTDSGYNTTGVYLSEENLSSRSRGNTLKDTETFSEDSLDNLDEASDNQDGKSRSSEDVGESDSNIEKLKQYFQEQNEIDEKDEIDQRKVFDSENYTGHISEDSLEESICAISNPEGLHRFQQKGSVSVPDRFAQSLPVSLDTSVPKPHHDAGDDQNVERQLGSPDSLIDETGDKPGRDEKTSDCPSTADSQYSELFSQNSGITDLKRNTFSSPDATCTEFQNEESLDENENHPRLPSQHVPANDTEFQNSNEVSHEGNRLFQDQNHHEDHEKITSEGITTVNNDIIMSDTNVVAYVDSVGGGDHVNVLAMDNKDGESVYVVVCDEPPVDGGGDGPVRLDSEKEVEEQEPNQMSEEQVSSLIDNNSHWCPREPSNVDR